MRAVLATGAFPTERLLWASALNALYLGASLVLFARIFRYALKRGIIPKIGE
jgi:hypothetical protein